MPAVCDDVLCLYVTVVTSGSPVVSCAGAADAKPGSEQQHSVSIPHHESRLQFICLCFRNIQHNAFSHMYMLCSISIFLSNFIKCWVIVSTHQFLPLLRKMQACKYVWSYIFFILQYNLYESCYPIDIAKGQLMNYRGRLLGQVSQVIYPLLQGVASPVKGSPHLQIDLRDIFCSFHIFLCALFTNCLLHLFFCLVFLSVSMHNTRACVSHLLWAYSHSDIRLVLVLFFQTKLSLLWPMLCLSKLI